MSGIGNINKSSNSYSSSLKNDDSRESGGSRQKRERGRTSSATYQDASRGGLAPNPELGSFSTQQPSTDGDEHQANLFSSLSSNRLLDASPFFGAVGINPQSLRDEALLHSALPANSQLDTLPVAPLDNIFQSSPHEKSVSTLGGFQDPLDYIGWDPDIAELIAMGLSENDLVGINAIWPRLVPHRDETIAGLEKSLSQHEYSEDSTHAESSTISEINAAQRRAQGQAKLREEGIKWLKDNFKDLPEEKKGEVLTKIKIRCQLSPKSLAEAIGWRKDHVADLIEDCTAAIEESLLSDDEKKALRQLNIDFNVAIKKEKGKDKDKVLAGSVLSKFQANYPSIKQKLMARAIGLSKRAKLGEFIHAYNSSTIKLVLSPEQEKALEKLKIDFNEAIKNDDERLAGEKLTDFYDKNINDLSQERIANKIGSTKAKVSELIRNYKKSIKGSSLDDEQKKLLDQLSIDYREARKEKGEMLAGKVLTDFFDRHIKYITQVQMAAAVDLSYKKLSEVISRYRSLIETQSLSDEKKEEFNLFKIAFEKSADIKEKDELLLKLYDENKNDMSQEQIVAAVSLKRSTLKNAIARKKKLIKTPIDSAEKK